MTSLGYDIWLFLCTSELHLLVIFNLGFLLWYLCDIYSRVCVCVRVCVIFNQYLGEIFEALKLSDL